MLIFLADNGRSLEVAVEPTTMVSAIMETLVGVTGISFGDQILMSDRIRLDPSKQLSTFGLPETDGSKTKDVFLYNKCHLRIGGPPPPLEVAKPLEVEEPLEDDAAEEPADLGGFSNPLVRALAQYERQFRWHVKVGLAGLAVARQRQRECCELVSEMEVQSSAIDSARKSVEVHYTYIHTQLTSFIQQYATQRKAHADLLAGFEGELEALGATELHPAACAPGQTRLVHLVNAPRLREWAAECRACHHSLAQKVAELEELFGGLRTDVEAVFMQAPTVQLEALATQVDAMSPHLEELASILQVLENDSGHVRRLVAAQAREGGAGTASASDNCQLMETVDENHASHLLPQVERYRDMYRHLYQRCVDDKNQMSRDVVGQLQAISSQQMKIQSMRNKLAVFREAAAKEDDMFAQLLLVRRIPVAYRQCLAECMRRQAFSEVYAGQARQMAERMGKLRGKECERRDAFRRQVQAYVPLALLTGLGLHHQPAHCQISLPSQPPGLPTISPADLQRLPAGPMASLGSQLQPGRGNSGEAGQGPGEPEASEPASGPQALQEAEMENARLRAQVADLCAQECVRELQQPLVPTPVEPTPASPQGGGGAAPGGGQGGRSRGEQQALATKKLQAALAAKQEVVAGLERSLTTARQQSQAYESRILELEQRLAAQAAERPQPSEAQARPPSPGGVPSGGEAMDGAGDGGEAQPMPIPLTPVMMSPTRSVSPAHLDAIDHGEALTTALGVSASAAALRASQTQASTSLQSLGAAGMEIGAGEVQDEGLREEVAEVTDQAETS